MKLLMLTGSYNRSFKEEGFIADWIDGLAQKVDQLIVITTKPSKYTKIPKNITIYSLNQKNKLSKFIYLSYVLLTEHFKKPFTGIFCHIFDFLGVCGGLWGRILNIKSIMWYAGGIPIKKYSLIWWALKLNNEIATCSSQEKKRYRLIFNLHKPIHVLGHAINIDRFTKHISKNKIYTIGSMGRATPMKNFKVLIKACQLLTFPTHLILALSRTSENTQYVKQLKKRIKNYPKPQTKISIQTNINYQSVPNFFNKLDLYVHPSLMKSIDKAGLEAIAAKIPTLLSTTGYQEVVGKNSPLLFNPSDEKSLAKSITKAHKPSKGFKDAQQDAQTVVLTKYSISLFMKKLTDLY